MPTINFSDYKKPIDAEFKKVFRDLKLDIPNPLISDFKMDYDENAIKNSLVNLFNTLPGQNLLIPEYSLNLLKFLFEPVTEFTGKLIAQEIMEKLTTFEPRVQIEKINVVGRKDEQEYVIDLILSIPTINKTVKIPGILTKNGYTVL